LNRIEEKMRERRELALAPSPDIVGKYQDQLQSPPSSFSL